MALPYAWSSVNPSVFYTLNFTNRHPLVDLQVLHQGVTALQNGSHFIQTHETAMGTEMALAFANIFMAKIEKEMLGGLKVKEGQILVDDINN